MAVTRVVPTSGGSTANPLDRAAATGQSPMTGPNSSWYLKFYSDYNKPSVLTATPDRIDAAAQAQAETLRRIQEAQRLRLEAMAAQAQQQEPLTLFGAPMRGPIGQAITSVVRDPMSAIAGVGEFLTSEAPNFPVSTSPTGQPLTGATQKPKVDTVYKGPDKPGFVQQPVLDQYGQVAGYRYVKLNQVETPSIDEVSAAQASGFNPRVSSREVGYIGINDEIKALENSFSNRKVQAAIDIWGKPDEITNPDGSKSLKWGTNGMEYLGLQPGQVKAPTLNAPGPDASYEDLVKYRNRLQRQIRKPLYTPDSLNTIFDEIGISGIKQFQKTVLKARLYDTNDPVSFGNLSKKDYSIMQGLMEDANVNGTTWEEQLAIRLQNAEQAAAEGRGGGGGGSGGGGNSVYTQITYNQTSLSQGRATLTAILKNAIGRMPTDQELADFIAMLNEAESQSPTRTVTRTTKTGDRTRSIARTTPSDVDAEQMAREFAAQIGGGAPMIAKGETDYLMGYLNSLGQMQ